MHLDNGRKQGPETDIHDEKAWLCAVLSLRSASVGEPISLKATERVSLTMRQREQAMGLIEINMAQIGIRNLGAYLL
jgi:hypothetical protein